MQSERILRLTAALCRVARLPIWSLNRASKAAKETQLEAYGRQQSGQLEGLPKSPPGRRQQFDFNGEVSEWPKEHAWKVCKAQVFEGSTPSLTAI